MPKIWEGKEKIHRKEEISLKDSFIFPTDLRHLYVDDKIIILSPETANWLVVNQDALKWIDKLISGVSFGIILEEAKAISEHHIFTSLLSQIKAREFASIRGNPHIVFDNPSSRLHIYLTNACNLRCKHCFMSAGEPYQNEITLSSWLNLIDDFKNAGGEYITFSGGEPLCHPDWHRIFKYAYNTGLKLTLLSNGTLWSASDIEFCSHILEEVQISIDGPTEESNAKVRGPCAFSPSMNTALALAKAGVKTSVAITPTMDNLSDLKSKVFDDFYNYLINISNEKISIKITHKLLRGRNVESTLNDLYEKDVISVVERVMPQSSIRNFRLDHQPNKGFNNCGYGGLSISANGFGYACNRISELSSLGSICEDGFSELYKKAIALAEDTSVDKLKPCCECSIRYICGGPCRIDSGVTESSYGIKAVTCSENFVQRILKKMILSTESGYEFN